MTATRFEKIKELSPPGRIDRAFAQPINVPMSEVLRVMLIGPHDWHGAFTAASQAPPHQLGGANYDDSLKSWLADQFAYQLFVAGSSTPGLTLETLYQHLYQAVGGSHVTVYNSGQFGKMGAVALQEFLE